MPTEAERDKALDLSCAERLVMLETISPANNRAYMWPDPKTVNLASPPQEDASKVNSILQ